MVILSLSLNLTILRLYRAILFFYSEFEFKSHNSAFISGNSIFVVILSLFKSNNYKFISGNSIFVVIFSLSLNLTILRLYLAILFFFFFFEFKSHNSKFISGNSIFVVILSLSLNLAILS